MSVLTSASVGLYVTHPTGDCAQQPSMGTRVPCKMVQVKKGVHVSACKKAQTGLPSEA